MQVVLELAIIDNPMNFDLGLIKLTFHISVFT